MSAKCRKYLEKSLASLLGFDIEDIVDIIEHLLYFESKDDLLEHLTALLGRNDDDVISFVNNVVKFQHGEDFDLPQESISGNNDDADGGCLDGSSALGVGMNDLTISNNDKKKEVNIKVTDSYARRKNWKDAVEPKMGQSKSSKKNHQQSKQSKQSIKIERQIQKEKSEQKHVEKMKIEQQKELDRIKVANEEKEKNMKEVGLSNDIKASCLPKKNLAKGASVTDSAFAASKQVDPVQPIVKTSPARPRKGKAAIICGCFGTIHKPLANCLYCGRIACKKEGYSYCPSCSNIIDEYKMEQDETLAKAILHKNRLLQFDRESASRTQIFDSQADYYSNSTSNWLSEKEQLDAEDKEEERRQDLHSRKHILTLGGT